ncbi:MAG TPA: heterodisulfide reductase-related iron-sulfur binding cluster [Methylomirabilota bacterium]|jgi:glycolate oxidase iron-sulfur subunit
MTTATTAPAPSGAPRPAAPRPGVLAELEYGQLLQCVHCGLCLPSCPTYAELGQEPDSPRGRIYLIKALADGRIELGDSVAEHLSLCLGCRACESACPSGVSYGHLIEAGRAELEVRRPGSPLRRLVRRVALEGLLPRPGLLRLVAGALRFYQRSGLQRLVRASGILRLFPATLAVSEGLLPPLPPARRGGALPEVIPARGARRGRVGLLHGCVQDAVFRPHNEATIRCLARQGVEVHVPRAQACCGALHAHAGEPEGARALARATIAAFEAGGLDAVVVNAAGCGAHMKAYGHLLRGDPAWAGRAAAFARTVADVTEFLARAPLEGPLGPLPLRATYHDPCHLAHGQQVRSAPRALLRAVPGLELVDLVEAEMCCGSAGIYNLTEPVMAQRLLDRKMAHVEATGAAAVVTANPGCILQLAAGLRARGRNVEVLHVVEVLDRAYRAAERGRP